MKTHGIRVNVVGCGRILVFAAMGLVAAGALSEEPQTRPAANDARMSRGEHLRGALLATLELAYQHDGSWPGQPVGDKDALANLVYSRPVDDVAAEPLVAAATVALHEPIERHPDGIWVGYADGHLEFAPDAKALAECQAQQPTARRAVKIRNSRQRPQTQPAVSGQLKLKLVDPDGKPVAGARVGQFGHFGDDEGVTTPAQHCMFYSHGRPVPVLPTQRVHGGQWIASGQIFCNAQLSRKPSRGIAGGKGNRRGSLIFGSVLTPSILCPRLS